MNTETVTGIISAVATTATGLLAWQAARSANKAAHESAQVVKDADRDRRWNALTPQLTYTCVARDDGSRAELRIRLDGPIGLERLDRVTVRIRDDRPNRAKSLLAGGPTAEEVARQVWGPYRLNTNVENVNPSGRYVTFPDGVVVGEDLVCALEDTIPPPWNPDRRWWADQVDGMPVRITVECERDAHVPWRIKKEVPVLGERGAQQVTGRLMA
ncbi:hypothetical protein [Salinispora arenicola]|uniref:hypothetical protein n=1 Tax=Salinispora arenicola TaxID=168697 RepID=UPI000361CB4E|nr:hypothetical protein [Salinispora arenicola]